MENLKSHQITEQIWHILLSMEDQGDDPIFIGPNHSTDVSYLDLSFIQATQEWQPITKNDAYTKILEAVHKSLEQNNRVFLYYCPDNALISIEDSSDLDEDTLSLYDQESNNFYIGKD